MRGESPINWETDKMISEARLQDLIVYGSWLLEALFIVWLFWFLWP